MHKRTWTVFLFLFIVSGIVTAQEPNSTPDPATTAEATYEPTSEVIAPPTTEPLSSPEDLIPPEIAAHSDDWPLANKDYANTRAALTSDISSATVDQLEVAWSFLIPGRANYGAAASAPLIVAGVVYFQDLQSNTFALDLIDGDVVWEQRYDSAVIGPNGPGIGYGMIFINSGVDTFAALDMNTGTEVWSRDTNGRPTGAFQPYAYGNAALYTTQAGVGGEGDVTYRGYAPGTSGHIMALNPQTGETLWEFQTIEEGFWGNPEVNSGAGIWFPPAIDPLTGLTFWGTGNPAPFPGTFEFPNASSRPEPNLYANSLLALRHDTGELVWYNYVNPNDIFDLDLQLSPMLATVNIGGIPREVVIASGKLGYVYGIDRMTGETIWETAVGIHENDDLTEIPPGETVRVFPGVLGGTETPMAYADGVVYAPVLNLPTEYTATAWDAADGAEAVANAEAHTPVGQGTGELVALDAATGMILWSHEFDSGVYGGATVVSDLVFTATFDGMIYALNRASGETVWSYQAPAGINAWPAVADNTIVWPAGFGDNPSLIALRLPPDAMIQPEATTETHDDMEMPTAEATQAPEDAEATSEAPTEGEGGEAQSSEFISVDAENRTVTLNIIASYDDSNGGLNFNGYSNGEATYTVPSGWTVNVAFSNNSNLPHSVGVVPSDAVGSNDLPPPPFDGAVMPEFTTGTTESAEFSFTPDQEGTYALACGVPGHASQGQWIVLEIGASDIEPTFQPGG